jgi:hypothetical protein
LAKFLDKVTRQIKFCQICQIFEKIGMQLHKFITA